MSVPMNRLLKYINITIGVVLVAMAIGGYWVFYRPLPVTEGRVEAPVIAEAEIVRDELGVPHISAGNEDDALFLQGYVTAQDRIFQMDLGRRKTAGELAEILGPRLLDSDRETRRLRLRRLAEIHARSLREADMRAFAAYARGVNFYLETHRDRLPVEFRLLGYDPRPWSVVDSVLVGLQVFLTLSDSWETELLKGSLTRSGDPEKVRALFPVRSDSVGQPGSNAWVVSGSRSATGTPLMANDPHLAFSVPSFWYQVHLQAPNLNVVGVSIPGLPGVIFGHNQQICWGATSLPFDVQDLFAEQLDPRTGRYAYRGEWRQARREQDQIRVKGQSSEPIATWVTHHGPIVVEQGSMRLALRWTAAEPGGFQYPYLDINRARSWEEFRAALTEYPGPALNFVYADTDGNIGYQAAGRLPARKHDGSEPAGGASGDSEWNGYIPFEELPSESNPASGMIVSANENPFPADYPYRVNGRFDPGFRARRIRELLSANEKWTVPGMLTVQTDVFDSFLRGLAQEAVAAWERRGKRAEEPTEVVESLREWDGVMDKDEAAPLIALLLFQHLRRAVAERASADAGLAYRFGMAPVVLESLLKDRPKEWFEDWDQVLASSLADAVEEGRRLQGDKIGEWKYGRYNQIRLSGGTVTQIPFLGRYFQLPAVPRSGSPHTVQQITRRLGPSMRMVVETGRWDGSVISLTLGQSGQRFSPHFDDQWETYLSGGAFPMEYLQVKGHARLLAVPER